MRLISSKLCDGFCVLTFCTCALHVLRLEMKLYARIRKLLYYVLRTIEGPVLYTIVCKVYKKFINVINKKDYPTRKGSRECYSQTYLTFRDT